MTEPAYLSSMNFFTSGEVSSSASFLTRGVVLVALLHGEEVAVGVVLRGLQDEGVLRGLEVGLDGVVAVDDGGVDVVEGARGLGRLQLLELEVLGVLDDVGGGGLVAGAVLEGDEPVGGEQLEGAGLVDGVVGDGDGRTALQLVGLLDLVRVEAERLQVHRDDGHDVGALLLVEVVEVRLVLEVVGAHRAVLRRRVGG
ncbi:hypothetical protein GCM10020256_64190 [Streptomyces thermocoprophilus]